MTFCGNKDTQTHLDSQSSMEGFTRADTIEVLDMTNKCMEDLKNGEIIKAIDFLYVIDQEGMPVKLSEEQKSEYEKRFQSFPVLSYKLESFSFDGEAKNTVKYSTVFFEKKESDKMPNTIAVVFNPVKMDGKWLLTLKNMH